MYATKKLSKKLVSQVVPPFMCLIYQLTSNFLDWLLQNKKINSNKSFIQLKLSINIIY